MPRNQFLVHGPRETRKMVAGSNRRSTTMKLVSPTDQIFLLGESREHPVDVGALQLFMPPKMRDRSSRARPTTRCWNARGAAHLEHPRTSPESETSPGVSTRKSNWTTTCAGRHCPTRAGSRATRVDFAPARQPARPPSPAMGGAPDRRARGRALRGLHQVPSLVARRGVGAAAVAACVHPGPE